VTYRTPASCRSEEVAPREVSKVREWVRDHVVALGCLGVLAFVLLVGALLGALYVGSAGYGVGLTVLALGLLTALCALLGGEM